MASYSDAELELLMADLESDFVERKESAADGRDWSSCFTDRGAGEALEGVRREAARRCPCDDSR